MKKNIALLEQDIAYTIKTSTRAERMRLVIYPTGEMVVTAPQAMSESVIDAFIKRKSAWIVRTLARFKKNVPKTVIESGRNGFARYKAHARVLAENRLAHFNAFYQFRFNAVTIRNQKARWGSCSKNGNLNFNYK